MINSIIKRKRITNNKIIDLVLPKIREVDVPIIDEDIVLIGVSVYVTGILLIALKMIL